MTESEVRQAFERAKADACEVIGEGEPLEINSPIRFLTNRDRNLERPPLPASRTGLLSIGLELADADKAELPVLSRSQVLDYLDSNYVLLQARVRKDLLDRKLYYHHRPIAVTARYTGTKVSQPFEPLVAQTTRNIRSLGVFVDPNIRPTKPQHLRTLVMIYYNEMMRPSAFASQTRKVEQYEWVFVRGVETESGEALQPHVFVTEENRTKLTYLRGFQMPSRVSQCDVIGKIAITGFDRTGIFPESYLTRSYRLHERRRYDWSDLEEKCVQMHGDGMESQLNQMLDSLISDSVKSEDHFDR